MSVKEKIDDLKSDIEESLSEQGITTMDVIPGGSELPQGVLQTINSVLPRTEPGEEADVDVEGLVDLITDTLSEGELDELANKIREFLDSDNG